MLRLLIGLVRSTYGLSLLADLRVGLPLTRAQLAFAPQDNDVPKVIEYMRHLCARKTCQDARRPRPRPLRAANREDAVGEHESGGQHLRAHRHFFALIQRKHHEDFDPAEAAPATR